jgi:parvulin-like peptidyl-prolyl isomerase
MTVARVGDKVIFYGDAAAVVNLIMEPFLAKAKSEAEREQIRTQIEAEREALTKNVVKQIVQTKLLYHEFDRDMRDQIGKDVKKYDEAKSGMNKKIRSFFEKSLVDTREKLRTATPEQAQKLLSQDPTVGRLAQLMKDRQLESYGELDAALRQLGTTLDQQITAFGEHQLGMQAIRKHITVDPEVTHEEMLDYYGQHAAEYAVPAKVKFEVLTVKFANFANRQEAWNQIAQMGNAVYLGGMSFAEVAKKHSQEPNASSGGLYESVSQGSLASKTIDQAVFSLELRKLSQIIEDETGYHIIRVLERQPAGQTSFVEAQPEIKQAIKVQKRSAEQKKFLQELSARTTVWTIYDDTATAGAPSGTQQR